MSLQFPEKFSNSSVVVQGSGESTGKKGRAFGMIAGCLATAGIALAMSVAVARQPAVDPVAATGMSAAQQTRLELSQSDARTALNEAIVMHKHGETACFSGMDVKNARGQPAYFRVTVVPCDNEWVSRNDDGNEPVPVGFSGTSGLSDITVQSFVTAEAMAEFLNQSDTAEWTGTGAPSQ